MGVAGLAVAAAASPPLRGWLASRIRPPAARAPVDTRVTERPSTSTPGVAVSHTAEVAFVPTSPTLTINLRATSGDSIDVRPTTSEAVRVRGRATGGEPTVVVMPDGLALVSPRVAPRRTRWTSRLTCNSSSYDTTRARWRDSRARRWRAKGGGAADYRSSTRAHGKWPASLT